MPNRLPWSVTATAGIPIARTVFTSGLTHTNPSTIENSVCTRKWMKSDTKRFPYNNWPWDNWPGNNQALEQLCFRAIGFKTISHRRIATPMLAARPQPLQRLKMIAGSVTFMARKAVTRVPFIQRDHGTVSGHLG